MIVRCVNVVMSHCCGGSRQGQIWKSHAFVLGHVRELIVSFVKINNNLFANPFDHHFVPGCKICWTKLTKQQTTNTMIAVSLFPVRLPFHHPAHSQHDPKGAVHTFLQSSQNHSQQVLVESHHAMRSTVILNICIRLTVHWMMKQWAHWKQ